jgi:hypothetical protein
MRHTLPSVVLFLALTVCVHAQTFTAAPARVNFQGRLARPDGSPVPDGSHTLTLSLWDAPSAGTRRWEQVSPALVRNGVFVVTFDYSTGFVGGFNLNTAFNGTVYLQISVDGGAPLTPRQQMVSVPYALRANAVADGGVTNASIANGAITANKFASGLFNTISWLLTGNSGTTASHFLGTTDNKPLELRVNNHRAMRYQYVEHTSNPGNEFRTINVLGGSEINSITPGVFGATISGGGSDSFSGTDKPNQVTANFGTVGGGTDNTITDNFGTVAGGHRNQASGFAFVGGGTNNKATEFYATIAGGAFNTASHNQTFIGGGFGNIASGFGAMVPGGQDNEARGALSFAAGNNAHALHDGSFVWADSSLLSNAPVNSTGNNQFLIRAAGGVGINTNNPSGYALYVNGHVGIHDRLTIGNTFQQTSVGEFFIDAPNVVGGRLRVQTNGNVGIGTTAPSTRLDVNGAIRCTSLTQTSDARYKTNIATFPDALDAILNLRGVTFDWDKAKWAERNFSEGRQIGFLAQEVEKILPELVSTDSNGYKSVAYQNVVPVLVEAVKTLNGKVETLKKVEAENSQLKARLEVLETAMAELKAQRK